MHVVIIGGVAAGMSTASKLKRLNKAIDITVYEKGEDLSYGACGMPYYLSDMIPDIRHLIAKTKHDFEQEGITVNTLHEVVNVDEQTQSITVKDLPNNKMIQVHYDRLIIGSGASPIRLPFGKDKDNVYTLNSLDDARRLKHALQNEAIKNILIIGGGYIGLEVAENILKLPNKDVRIIERESRLLLQFDAFIGEQAEKTLKTHGANIHLSETVNTYDGDKVVHTVQTDKQSYHADLVIEAIGIRPNTTFLENSSIIKTQNGAIIVDERLQTNVKNIYAAGDCAAYQHRILKQPVFLPLGTHANKAGRIIAENIAGNPKPFGGVLGSSVLKVCNLDIAKTGLGETELKQTEIPYDSVTIKAKDKAGYYPNATPIDIRVYYNKETCELLGAQMVGQQGVAHRINTVAVALSQQMTAEQFSQLDFAYAPPFSPVYDPLQIATNQIKCHSKKRSE